MVKWEFIKTSMISLAQAFWKKRCQGQKMETKTISHGFNQPQCSGLLCQASGGKNNIFELKIEKAQNQTYFSF